MQVGRIDLLLAAVGGFAIGWGCCALWTARWLDALRRRQQQQLEEIGKDRW
jgi:hypothetical protein